MSEVTKYQFFIDNMKLILKLKNMLDFTNFKEVVEDKMVKTCIEKGVGNEDIDLLKEFMFNLNESSFYDECMKIYLAFSKYDDDISSINFLHFQKLELYNFMINNLAK